MIYELNQAADTRKSKMNAVPDKLWEELNYASPSELERAINANQGILTQHAHRMRLLEDDLTIVRLELDKNSSIKNKLVSLNNYRNCKK